MPSSSKIYEFGPFRADLGRQVLLREGTPVHLPPKTFALLAALLREHGEIVSKERLIAALWPDTVGTEANLSVNVAALRRLLGENPKEHRYIVTIPQRGYAFVAEVEEPNASGDGGAETANPVDAGKVHHLAVLPFRVVDPGGGGELFGLGFADGLITHLAKVPTLSVRSTGAVRRFLHDPMGPARVGAELKVSDVIEGTLTRSDDRLTLTVQLVRCRDGSLTWGETYEGGVQDVQDLQIRIAEDLMQVLKTPRDPDFPRAELQPPSRDIKAYGLYLRARAHSSGHDFASLFKSLELFEAALDRDPEFAMAHTALADVYHTLWVLGRLTTQQAVTRIEEGARKALALDSGLADAHVCLGNVAVVYRHDLKAAERHFLKSLELSPNAITALRYYSAYLIVIEDPHKALAIARRGQVLDPTSMPINLAVASALYYMKEYERAMGLLRAMAEVEPRFTWAQFMVGLSLIQLHREEEAVRHLRVINDRFGDGEPWTLSLLGYLEARHGNREKALRCFDVMASLESPPPPPAITNAILHLGLGDWERALDALEQAYADRHPFVCYLHVEPFWEPLGDEPRFRNLIQRIGFGTS
jgi:DNA-binding winged helix-turn-helix (wHTH) protein/tetratricopeptide (TPR) repeat protein